MSLKTGDRLILIMMIVWIILLVGLIVEGVMTA